MVRFEIPEDRGDMTPDEVNDYIYSKLDQITRKLVVDLFMLLIVWTPVDTGRARAGWGIGKGRPSLRTPPEGRDYYDEPRPPRSMYRTSLRRSNLLTTWFITNNVEYIEVLDDGRGFRDGQTRGSEQAPSGMTSLALQELERSIT